jgi:hypothetical protein
MKVSDGLLARGLFVGSNGRGGRIIRRKHETEKKGLDVIKTKRLLRD